MMDSEQKRLWDDFLASWPADRVRSMTLAEYTNPGKDDSFIYWIESRTDKIGSIWGGSAFKFGIYCRDSREQKEAGSGRIWGNDYAWLSKYGTTETEAFGTIRGRLITVLDAVQTGNLDRIDEVDLSPVLKWKVAFLYQNREKPVIFPIFKKEALFYHYRAIDPSAKMDQTPYSVMYTTLLERNRNLGDVLDISAALWNEFDSHKNHKPRAWAVPLAYIMEPAQCEPFCSKTRIGPEDVDTALNKMLSEAELSEGDWLAMLVEQDVRALGTLTHAESGQYSWDQSPVRFPSGLLVTPTYEVRELDAAEKEQIWSQARPEEPTPEQKSPEKIVPAPAPVETPVTDDLLPPTPCQPRCIILYGPPGTGKTYSTIRRALKLILGESVLEDLSDDALVKIFREKQAQGQIEFVTFHQAYGYEEFVEGIRPVFGNHEGNDVRYELHDGVFKRIALRAASEGLISRDAASDFDALWSMLIKSIQEEENRVSTSYSGKHYVLRTSGRGSLHIYPCELGEDGSVTQVDEATWQIASIKYTRKLWEYRNELGPEPKDIDYQKAARLFAREFNTSGGHHYAAVWIAYKEVLNLSRSVQARKQGGMAQADRVQQVLDKPGAGGASFTFSAALPQYVLIIDEINRGNISKILGELITLLEPDKRLGMPSELKLPLSYSPEHRFAVPPNLHVIGTMNTADRSIALMDVALRRRFTFEELMPDSGIIDSVLAREVASRNLIHLIVDLFDTLNQRIRFVYDRDHQLGHAYFLGVRSLEDLRQVFVDRVIPLLQEYFYGAWDKICMVLGCPYTDDGRPARGGSVIKDGAYLAPIISARVFEEEATFGFDHSDYENRMDYGIDTGFASGGQPDERLLPYFLGVLPENKAAAFKLNFTGFLPPNEGQDRGNT